MDNLQPPEELRELWLDPHPRKENVDMIVARVLQGEKKHQQLVHTMDIALITFTAILIPYMLFGLSRNDSPILIAGVVVLVACLVAGLVAYRSFYRSLGDLPAANVTSRTYLEHCIEYVDQRQHFHGKTSLPQAGLLLLAAIAFTLAAAHGEHDGVVSSAACWLGLLGGWCGTVLVRRQLAARKAHLRQILEDIEV